MKSPRTRKLFGALVAALAISLTSRVAPAYAVGGGSDATDRFLNGTHINVGIQQNGTFGSVGNAPVGMHTRPGSGASWSTAGDARVGFTYDNGDGWGTGADIGDFFLPGSPYEGFALQVGLAEPARNAGTGQSGLGLGTWSACDGVCETWTMDTAFNGIGLVQVYSIVGDDVLKSHVTLTNTTSSTINDIYFSRCVDPDNIEADEAENYATYNSVAKTIADDGIAAAKATATFGGVESALSVFSPAPTARANVGCDRLNAADNWNGVAEGLVQLKGEPIQDDTNIGVTVKIASLAAGASTSFDLSYGLSPTAGSLPSTNTEWSPMSAILAISAALVAAAGVLRVNRERSV